MLSAAWPYVKPPTAGVLGMLQTCDPLTTSNVRSRMYVQDGDAWPPAPDPAGMRGTGLETHTRGVRIGLECLPRGAAPHPRREASQCIPAGTSLREPALSAPSRARSAIQQ